MTTPMAWLSNLNYSTLEIEIMPLWIFGSEFCLIYREALVGWEVATLRALVFWREQKGHSRKRDILVLIKK